MRQFLWTFGLSFTILLLATAAFNIIVDADALFGSPRIQGFNARKTQWTFRTQAFKPLAIGWRKPKTLILGSSRAGGGLKTKFLPSDASMDAYNAAVEGASIYTELRLYEHAQAVTKTQVKKVLLSLSLLGFNDAMPRNHPVSAYNHSMKKVIAVRSDGSVKKRYFFDLIDDTLKEMLTFNATQHSIKTILTQHTSTRNLYKNGAFDEPETPDIPTWSHYMRVARTFLIGNGNWFSGPRNSFIMRPHGPALHSYRKLLTNMYQDHTHAELMLNPIHAGMLVAMRAAGLWPCFQRWKRAVVLINRTIARQHGVKPFPVWDFAYAAGPAMEPVPPLNDRHSKMLFWRDPSHYTPALGRVIAARMYPSAGSHNVKSYGVRMNSINMDAWLAGSEKRFKKIRRHLPKLTAAIQKMVKRSLSNRKMNISCPVHLNPHRKTSTSGAPANALQ